MIVLLQTLEEMEKTLTQMLSSMENTTGESKLFDSKIPVDGKNCRWMAQVIQNLLCCQNKRKTASQSTEAGKSMTPGVQGETQMAPAAEKAKYCCRLCSGSGEYFGRSRHASEHKSSLLEPSLEKMNLPKAVFTMSAFLDALERSAGAKFIYDPSNPMPENLRELVKRLPEETQQTLVKYMLENKDMLLRDKTMLATPTKMQWFNLCSNKKLCRRDMVCCPNH